MPTITINGQKVEVPEGTNVLEACLSAGVPLEHFCYHRYLPVDGNCRTCMVEVDSPKGPVLGIACNTRVAEGMVVHTESEKATRAQKSALEFLLLDHPLDCPVCDKAGECKLQDHYMEYGRYDARRVVPRHFKGGKAVDAGEHIVLDQERCVLCTRCVRFLDKVSGTSELGIIHRGHEATITTFPGKPIAAGYSGNITDVCPVGALTLKEFRFQQRVWLLKEADSVCTGCARGCSITVEHNRGKVWRYMPRENPGLNRQWMCDEGRMSFKEHQTNRLLEAQQGGQATTLAAAKKALVALLSSEQAKVFGVASPHSSTETLFVLRELFSVLGLGKLVGLVPPARGSSDDILKLAAQYPNENGLRLLGIPHGDAELNELSARIKRGEVRVLLVVENDLVGQWGDVFEALAKQVEHLVVLSSHQSATVQAASLAIPIRTFAETDGTYVNATSLLQAARYALEPPEDDIASAALLLAEAGRTFADDSFPYTGISEIFAALASRIPEISGLSFGKLPRQGKKLHLATIGPEPFRQRRVDFNVLPTSHSGAAE